MTFQTRELRMSSSIFKGDSTSVGEITGKWVYTLVMTKSRGPGIRGREWVGVALRALFLFSFCGLQASDAQVLGNGSLKGAYFFRHVSLGMDTSGNVTDARSLIGAISFDGAGHYIFTGQQVIGSGAATAFNGSAGSYAVDPAGFVILDNPQRPGVKINARLGQEALLGSSTESIDNALDLFAAIRAPATGAATVFAGSYG